MINYGSCSGSCIGKVFVPAPDPAQFFNNKKFVQNLAVRSSIVS
jgi:hypothetical protein